MGKILFVVVLVLLVLTIAQMMRVYELSSKVRGRREEEITNRDNKMNAVLMLVFMFAFYAFVIWQFIVYGDGDLGPSASYHGDEIDWLYDLNFGIIIPVFFITNTLLFGFAFKYVYSKDRKALFYPHNNKLEMLWTVVPAVVLAVIIILGLKAWNNITDVTGNYQVQTMVAGDGGNKLSVPATFSTMEEANTYITENNVEGAIIKEQKNIELYAKQFDWTIRYAGEDNQLGDADFKLITGVNPLGLISSETIEASYKEIDEEVLRLEGVIEKDGAYIPDAKLNEMTASLERLRRKKTRIQATILNGRKDSIQTDSDNRVYDDVVVKGELHLVVNQPYVFTFRSQEVIHSAYFPHFRAQMNCVPGMETRFPFTPTITTKDFQKDPSVVAKYDNINRMRAADGRDEAEAHYILVCNKICGAAHSNMWIRVIVETQEEYDAWMAENKPFKETLAQ